MKKKLAILSAQKWKEYYAIQVVYEWENIIAQVLDIPFDFVSQIEINRVYQKHIHQFFHKFIRNSFLRGYIDISYNYLLRKKSDTFFINFQLYVMDIPNHYIYQPNFISIIIDCFRDRVDRVPELFKKNPLVFVTDYEVFQYLQLTSIAPKLRFIPLSISDIYYRQTVPEKKIDVLQMGRQNPVLHDWMMEVARKFPSIEYVYAEKKNEMHTYFSTTRGWIEDKADTREQFIQLLSSAKISLVSSPGVDGGELTRTGGFNPVTPRFYESAVSYCYMIGRFPDSPDFIYNKVANVCERPTSYEEFEMCVIDLLHKPFDRQAVYEPFIQQHLTSTVAKTIKKEIDGIFLSK